MKTLIDIPNNQIKSLAMICDEFNISRSEAIRRGIDLFITKNNKKNIDVFGVWKNKNIDGLKYQNNLRNEW
jgi:hypothetical protein